MATVSTDEWQKVVDAMTQVIAKAAQVRRIAVTAKDAGTRLSERDLERALIAADESATLVKEACDTLASALMGFGSSQPVTAVIPLQRRQAVGK